MLNKVNHILNNIFGYTDWLPYQAEVIESVLNRQDTLAVMPTGGGKSLCYQIPALIFSGLTIVISPLIALMRDQVNQLKELGIKAVLINSQLDLETYKENWTKIKNREVKLLYLAPEMLLKPGILGQLSAIPIDCIAIDESHCISFWGHDFRPEYREIARLRDHFPGAAWIALTATATKRVQKDIIESLDFSDYNLFIASFNRPNLYLQVEPKLDSFNRIVHFLNRFKQESGIIYCSTRDRVDKLYQKLSSLGFKVKPYHAGLSDDERNRHQTLFLNNEINIMVATIAFGMGIHKNDIRFIIHRDMPKNLEAYYQEIGRAGRDGCPAKCLLFYSYSDVRRQLYLLEKVEDNRLKAVLRYQLKEMEDFCKNYKCRRLPLLTYFGENYSLKKCRMCDNCEQAIGQKTENLTILATKIINCIVCLKEKFGITHVINVLRGSKEKKVLNRKHNELSAYNTAREYTAKQLKDIVSQLLKEGYLLVGDFNCLKLTDKAELILNEKQEFYGSLADDMIDLLANAKINVQNCTTDYDIDLFELLRKKRKEISCKAKIPPYMVFSDRTLKEMAGSLPSDNQALFMIHGIGEKKIMQYGPDFLEIIRRYKMNKEANQLSEKKVQQTAINPLIKALLEQNLSQEKILFYWQEMKEKGTPHDKKNFILALIGSVNKTVPVMLGLSFFGKLNGVSYSAINKYLLQLPENHLKGLSL